MSLKKRHEVFNPYREALFLLRKVEDEGCFIKDYEDPEKAQEVVLKLNSLLSYDIEGVQNYGALIVRETEVNVFSYWNPISEEEENKILERKKRELWNKHSKKQPAWYKKYRQDQQEKRKQGSKYRK
jgi:L-rhamnose mutarotase